MMLLMADLLVRIEEKLDRLILALADDYDEGDEQPPALTLDGEPAGQERDQGQEL